MRDAEPCLLLTGFEPFGGESVNPSARVAQALAGERIAGHRVVACELPCVFGAALTVLDEALVRHAPRLVLALGQAGGRCDLSIERVAINVDDARIADNAGRQPIDEPVVADGPAAHFSSLPIKAMVAALRAAGIPASVSQTAGTFVCNHVFYGLMQRLAPRAGVRGGFMHLPLLPEQAARHPGQACLPLATLVDGVRIALCAALEPRHGDLRAGGGSLG
jgi:pyroglutamyl-peptidase